MKWFKFLIVGLLFMPGNARAGDPLSPADLKKLAPATYNVSVAESVKAIVKLTGGGGISVATNKGERDTGRWSIQGNKLCVVFKHLLDHKPNCSTLTNENGMIHGDGFSARRR